MGSVIALRLDFQNILSDDKFEEQSVFSCAVIVVC